MVRITFFMACFLINCICLAQTDTTANSNYLSVFERITASIKEFKLDTTAAPDDKITRKIGELRNLRGGFNINEAIDFKLEEDRQKNEMPEEEIKRLSAFFKTGNGKRWLDNAVTWIYRRQFNYEELKELVKFYKTSAGQKMAANFPLVMMQSLMAAETIKEWFKNGGK